METAKLARFCTAAVDFAEGLNAAAARFEIHDGKRLRHFLAQDAHESAGFTRLEEGLNYTDPARLAKLFRAHFDLDHDGVIEPDELAFAQRYTHNPRALANFVYADRLGNGPEASGDGWAHRGMGLIQLTGKDNQRACSLYFFNDERLLDDAEWLLSPVGAALSAGWFWDTHGCNEAADRDDIAAVTALVHGRLFGRDPSLGAREQWLNRAIECQL